MELVRNKAFKRAIVLGIDVNEGEYLKEISQVKGIRFTFNKVISEYKK